MKQVLGFLKTKGFYIALGTGLVAFAGLMAMYDYSGNKESAKNEQAIDLNQPVQSEEVVEEEIEKPHVTVQETAGQSIKTPKEEKKDDKKETADVAGVTDAKEDSEIRDPEVIAASGAALPEDEAKYLAYDGTQVLAWPLIGTVVMPYSMDQTVYFKTLDCYRCNPGVMIAGNEGEAVYAVYDGVVSSVANSKEYGTIVTIDLGNGYQAMYGQLKNITVKEGDRIDKAQPIGEVAAVSTYYTEEGNHLYFAMTKDNVPIDPTYYMQ